MLGTDALTGVALGNLAGNLTGFTLIYGMLSAMETLAPQAFGAGRFDEVGLLAQVRERDKRGERGKRANRGEKGER
jgi:Na+-driven multidrug efflux pump